VVTSWSCDRCRPVDTRRPRVLPTLGTRCPARCRRPRLLRRFATRVATGGMASITASRDVLGPWFYISVPRPRLSRPAEQLWKRVAASQAAPADRPTDGGLGEPYHQARCAARQPVAKIEQWKDRWLPAVEKGLWSRPKDEDALREEQTKKPERRSAAAPTSSASSPTALPSAARSAPCWPSSRTSGPSPAATCRSTRSRAHGPLSFHCSPSCLPHERRSPLPHEPSPAQ
jgi:hypothetical protein